MEQHERYDPEDIESLLSERAYDELLEEERAFVLRHLSGPEEYDRMRALLHYVRPDEHSRDSIEGEDRVRQYVLKVFRDQQQPQWRIWLNSVAAWFAPQEASAMWRPALAFASIVLLIVAGVLTVRQFEGNATSDLAEVKHVPQKSSSTEREQQRSNDLVVQEETSAEVPDLQAATGETEESDRASTAEVFTPVLMEEEQVIDDEVSRDMIDIAEERSENAKDMRTVTDQKIVAPTTTHVVTANELAQNYSLANGTGTVRAIPETARSADKAKREVNMASRSMAQDPALLSLLAAGW